MIVFYRGLHCPLCANQLRDLNRHVEEFTKRGITIGVVSSDVQERAQTAQTDWKVAQLDIGYGLSIETARAWGLFISAGIGTSSVGVEEPAEFSEPGIFLVRPDQTLYASAVNTMPFARPHFKDLVGSLDFIISKDYPARGEL